VTEPLAVLTVTTVTTAAFHTLIPDHWLPFVLVARAERWDARRAATLTAMSASLHVSVSIGLALAALLMGRGAEAVIGGGEAIGRISALLLVVFGAGYALWFWFRGGHQHSFGLHPHHEAAVHDPPASPHPHDLPPEETAEHASLKGHAMAAAVPGAAGAAIAAGAQAPDRARGAVTRRGRLSGLALTGIVGLNPCLLLIPYVYLAGSMGTGALVAIAAAFALSTIACMVGVVMIGLKGTARLESPFLMRYGEVVSGAIIAATGLVIAFMGD
jgi:ABC-type nickel/cobalt efflux system permease component RcnA